MCVRCLFFFSSRRRHTRCSRDWSSDVCSSDLFVIVDGAMNDLLRPSLYGAIHPITKLTRDTAERNAKRQRADVVGPVCETGDCFLHDWPVGEVQTGNLRSEEHTSELQSRLHIECRLLLDKKKER